MMIFKVCDTSMGYNISVFTPELYTPVVVLHFVTAISAVLLNLLVIVTICKTRSLQIPSRILLCSLSFTDFCIGLIGQPVTAFFYLSAFNNWSDGFCIFWIIMTRAGYTIGIVALFSLAALSVDRCLAVTTLTRYKTLVTKRRTICFSILLWIFASFSTIGVLQLFSNSQKYAAVSVIGVVLLSTIIVSFSVAYHSLKKLSLNVSQGVPQHNGVSTSDFNISKYRRSLNTMVMILALNLAVYIPLLILAIAMVVRKAHNKLVYFQYFGFLISFNSTINPLFYLWRMNDLRGAVRVKLLQVKHWLLLKYQ